MVALVPTHDSDKRIRKTGKTGTVARFSDTEMVPAQGTFNKHDLTDSTNISFDSPTNQGWRRSDGLIAVTELAKAKDKEGLMATLIHEVQHDADLHLMHPEERYLHLNCRSLCLANQ